MEIVPKHLKTNTREAEWYVEWETALKKNPNLPKDKAKMTKWFATAISAGYSFGREYEATTWREKKRKEKLK